MRNCNLFPCTLVKWFFIQLQSIRKDFSQIVPNAQAFRIFSMLYAPSLCRAFMPAASISLITQSCPFIIIHHRRSPLSSLFPTLECRAGTYEWLYAGTALGLDLLINFLISSFCIVFLRFIFIAPLGKYCLLPKFLSSWGKGGWNRDRGRNQWITVYFSF